MLIIKTSLGLLGISFRHIRGDVWKQKLNEETSKEKPDADIVTKLSTQIKETFGSMAPRAITVCQLFKLPTSVEPLYAAVQDQEQSLWKREINPDAMPSPELIEARKQLAQHLRSLTLESLTREARADCSTSDCFQASVGRKISLTKCLMNIPKPIRTEIWRGYAQAVSRPFPKRCGWSWSNEQHQAIKRSATLEASKALKSGLKTRLQALRDRKAATAR